MRMNFTHVKYFGLIRYFSASFLYVFVALALMRAVFFARNYPEVIEDAGINEVVRAFIAGSRFDASIAGYFLIIPVFLSIILLIAAFFIKSEKYFRISVTDIQAFLLSLVFFVQITGIEYFNQFGQHLSFRDIQYIADAEVYSTILSDHWQKIIIYAVASALAVYSYKKIFINFSDKVRFSAPREKVAGIINLILISGLIVIAARGGTGVSNLNWGSSVISDNELINQSVLNPVFALVKSYDIARKTKISKTAGMFSGLEPDEEFLVSLLTRNSTFKEIPSENKLLRKAYTRKDQNDLNVVLILLEGWNYEYVNRIINGIEITPFFNKLSMESVNFTCCYATGTRSNKGIESVICSVPCQYGISALKRMESARPYYSIPNILKDRDYMTSFVYGGDPEFDNMKGFLKINGIDRFIGEKDIRTDERSSKWGCYDEDSLMRLAEEMEKYKEPFFAFMFMLSSHEPFDLPEKFEKKFAPDHPKSDLLNSMIYSDHALAEFFNSIREKEYFKNTVFILISDHGRHREQNITVDRRKFHIPFIIFSDNDAVKEYNGTYSDICSQYDVLPTLMGILGGDYQNASWGRNLLSDEGIPYAYMVEGNNIALLMNDTLLVISPGRGAKLYDCNDRMIKDYNTDRFSFYEKFLKNILYSSTRHLNKAIHGK